MGNRESSDESVVEDESEKTKTKNDEQQCTADGTDGALGINVEQLTYNDIYLEESHESDEGLTDFTEDDSEDGDWRHMREFPDSVSVVSRARVFTAHLLLVVSYNRPQSALNVRIKGTTDVPGRGQGGPDAYQLMVTLMNNARQREYSKLRIGPNPTFDDKWTFHLPSADMMNAVMRFRLYACSLGQRTGVLGEGKLELSEVNPRLENSLTIRLVPPMEILTESEDEKNDPENKARIQGFIGEVGRNMNEMAQVPLPHPLDSELLLNAAYNPKTGRFECIVQQAHGINVPGTKNSKPYSYVQLILRNEDNTILASSKTKICKKLNNPSFNETFFFNLTASQVNTVTLVVMMYHKKPPGHKICLGGFSTGLVNTSKTEKEHWDEIIQSSGQRVARWHKLYLNVP